MSQIVLNIACAEKLTQPCTRTRSVIVGSVKKKIKEGENVRGTRGEAERGRAA